MALPVSMRAIADSGVVLDANVYGLDHLTVRQQARAPRFATRELDQVDTAFVDDLVDLVRVVAGEDPDRQRPFAFKQALQRRRPVLEPGSEAHRLGAKRCRRHLHLELAQRRPERAHNLRRVLELDTPLAARREHQPHEVGPGLGGSQRHLDATAAADLDPRHERRYSSTCCTQTLEGLSRIDIEMGLSEREHDAGSRHRDS